MFVVLEKELARTLGPSPDFTRAANPIFAGDETAAP